MTRGALVAVGVALLLVAAAAWWLWPDSSGEPTPGPAARRDAAEASADPQTGDPDRADQSAAADQERRQKVESQQVAAPPGSVLVRVVYGGAPVADAEVFYAADRSTAIPVGAQEQRARESGVHERSDARGHVRVPRPSRRGYWVFGRRAELWGEAWVDAGTTDDAQELELELELRTDATVSARLRDGATGRVVRGATISLSAAHWEGQFVNAMRSETDADGIASFAHVQARLMRGPNEHEAIVGLDFPLREPVQTSVDLRAIPAEPIELVLPATGSITLEFVDDAGPFETDMQFHVRFETVDAQTGETAFAPASIYTLQSRLSLQQVGLGLRLRVRVESDECTGGAEVLGPTTPGQEVLATVRIERQPLLVGRLVGPDGAPLPGSWRAVYAATGKWTSYRVHFATEEDGRFRMPLPPVFEGSHHTTFVVEPTARTHRSGPADVQGLVELDSRIPGTRGEHDLGDVVVRALPALVSGSVVNDRGEPVKGAGIRVQHVERGTIRETPLATRATSAVDGSFELRGNVPDVGLQVLAYKADHETVRVPFRPGDSGLHVVLPARGQIVGRVLLDPEIARQQIMVSWIEHASGQRSTMGGHIVVDERGELSLDGIEPGAVTVAFRAIGAIEPLARFPDVAVKASEPTRLPDVDLRGKLRFVTLRVRDADGQPVDGASVIIDPFAAAGSEREAPNVVGDLVRLVLQQPEVDLAVCAPGYRTEFLRGVTADATVTLRAGLRAKLVIDRDAVPSPPARLDAVLDPADRSGPDLSRPRDRRLLDHRDAYAITHGDPSAHAIARAPVDRDGTVTLRVAAPGRYRLRFEVHAGAGGVTTERAQPAEITVVESETVQTFRVAR